MTDYTLKNPIAPTIPNPIGLDAEIQDLQLAFASLPWLTKSFGRAREVNKIPMVYQGTSEYYPAMPNDALRAYSSFRLNLDKRANDYMDSDTLLFFTAPVDMIFWANLRSIDNSKDYVFTEELIRDVLAILAQNVNVTVVRIWDERPEDIFKNYEISKHRDLLMYPYAAFRIETLIRYEQNICP